MGNLGTAASAANNGLKAASEAMTAVANNIANVNTPGYGRRIVELKSIPTNDGIGAGAEVSAIIRSVDQDFVNAAIMQNPDVYSAQTFNNYYTEIVSLFGKPDDPSSILYGGIGGSGAIINNINELFNSLTSLSNNPELSSMKFDSINKLNTLTSNLNNLTKGLNNLRYKADTQIKDSVDNINSILTRLFTTNSAIASNYNVGANTSDLEEVRDSLLNSLSRELNIHIYMVDSGAVQVGTASMMLLDYEVAQLHYSPVTSVANFESYGSTGELSLYKIKNGDEIDITVPTGTIISAGYGEMAGVASTVTNILTSGNIYALQQLRDVQIPLILDQLDNFANILTSQFNAIHNNSTSTIPPSTLTGTRSVASTEGRDFTGKAMLAVVDSTGAPVLRADGTSLPPLTLDFDNIAGASIAGEMSVKTIIDEINQYFFRNYVEDRASLANIYDIKLVASSDLSSAQAGGSLSFDLELENDSSLNSVIKVIDVSVSGGCDGLTSQLPADFTSYAGQRARSGQNFTVSFANGSGGPYNVGITVEVTDQNGNISTGTINYMVDDHPSSVNVQNARYAASAANGSATFHKANAINGVAIASIVDSNGNDLDDGLYGFLQIRCLNGYGIAINDLTSFDKGIRLGSPYLPAGIKGTSKGFSGYFELNDLFVRNSISDPGTSNPSILGTAQNLAIRSDILADPTLLATAQLDRSKPIAQTEIQGITAASASLSFNANPSAGDTITLNGQVFTFAISAVGNNQITIGANLAATLSNIVNVVGATNLYTSGTVNQASFASDGISVLTISYKSLGVAGNNYNLACNLQNAAVSLNNAAYLNSISGNLAGGSQTEITQTIPAITYNIAQGNKVAIDQYLLLKSTNINFAAAGSLPAESASIYGYFSSIVSYGVVQNQKYSEQYDNQDSILASINAQIDATGGINLDQELSNALQYQTSYKASAKLVGIIRELYDELFSVFR